MSQELLKIENLTKRYDDNTVLQSINMTVRQGEVVVIIGPSGCGKSTFLRCINGLEPIQEGTISFEGELIDRKFARKSVWCFRITSFFHTLPLWIISYLPPQKCRREIKRK